jgi:hypothetical protein
LLDKCEKAFSFQHYYHLFLFVQVHEILIQNQDKGSVITWDFDVMRHDVVFSVFRTRDPVVRKKTPPTTPTTLGTFNIGGVASDPEHHTSIGRGWKEGVDYFRVETPVICHDGESIQVEKA